MASFLSPLEEIKKLQKQVEKLQDRICCLTQIINDNNLTTSTTTTTTVA